MNLKSSLGWGHVLLRSSDGTSWSFTLDVVEGGVLCIRVFRRHVFERSLYDRDVLVASLRLYVTALPSGHAIADTLAQSNLFAE